MPPATIKGGSVEWYNAISGKRYDNPNMPLRFLFYLSDLYGNIVKDKNMYGTKLIPLPSPHFVVFYNGTKEHPVYRELRLSEAYNTQEEQVSLDLLVKVITSIRGTTLS